MSSTPSNENNRVDGIRQPVLLNTEPESEFESIVQAAAAACEMPICLITLFNDDQYWINADSGTPKLQELAREASLSTHDIEHDGLLEVADCTLHSHFSNSALLQQPGIRFYAGIALRLDDGTRVGTLCVMDSRPGALSDIQKLVLVHLSQAASHALESRRIASTLAYRESQFHTLCAASPLGIFSVDIHGVFKYGNQRLLELFGLSAENALGTGWLQAIHPDDREAATATWNNAIMSKMEATREFRVVHPDGRVLTLAGILRPATTQGKLVSFVGSAEDITERKKHQEQQQRSLTHMRQTGALAGVGGWELDLRSRKVFWTEQTRLIHGVADDFQPDLESALSFYSREPDKLSIIETLNALMVGENKVDRELRLHRADGRTIWVRVRGEVDLVDGQPFRVRGAIQDIDAIVRQRKLLENAHDRISIATESGEIGVWEWDLFSGQLDWTPQMYKLYGVLPDEFELSIENFEAFLHHDDESAVKALLSQAIEHESRLDSDFRIIRRDGSVRHLRSCAHVKRDAEGQAVTMLGVTWDVTALRKLTSKLAEQHELLHVTLQSIDDAVITTNTRGLVTWLNPAAEAMTAWSCTDARGKSLEEVYQVAHEETGLLLESPLEECLRQAKPIRHGREVILLSSDGLRYGIEESAAPILDAHKQPLGVVLVFRDVTEQRRLRMAMNHRATHDELTQVFNRAEFESRLRKTLNSLRVGVDSHALLFIDLDEFKLVNDACGHPVGDLLLRQVATLLGQTLREGDTLARLGGDEFGVILNDCNAADAHKLGREICRRMNDFRFAHGERRFRVGASIGLVPLDDKWVSPASVMQAADTSCYAAKEAGRNRVHIWCESDQAMRVRRGNMEWAARLEESLDGDCFELYAQRLVSLVDGSSGSSAEVLIRLRDNEGSVILPGAFLPAAERYHLATRIDRWVLRAAIQALADLPCLANVERLWINLSGQSVGDREFHRYAIEMFKQAGSAVCECICLEITETAAVTNIADAAEFIIRLRELNVHTALDDFGAGASSFGYLKNLPVDVLKIDGQFIDSLVDDPLNAAAVRCFVDVARVLGLKTVAEFVQTPEALAYVKDMGVDYAQGFLLHEPEPIAQWLAREREVQDRAVSLASL